MRTGLVVVGIAIAVIGGGLFFTLFFISGGPTSTTRVSFDNPDIPGHSSLVEIISPSTTSAISIGLSWSTSEPANVSLTPASPCTNNSLGVCPTGPPLFSWTYATSGHATSNSVNAADYILAVTDPWAGTLRFTGVVSVSTPAGSLFPTWAWGLIALAGVVLLGIGAVAVFLGLFLPGGVYQNSPEETIRTRPPPKNPGRGPPAS